VALELTPSFILIELRNKRKSIGNFARIADGVNAVREEMRIARRSRFGPIEIVRLEIEKGLEATL
jgi:hypothetical protein